MSEISELNASLTAGQDLQRYLAETQRQTMIEVADRLAITVCFLGSVGLVLGLCAIFA